MTFAMGIVGQESIWVMADRRLTAGKLPGKKEHRVVKDDATKVFTLEARDGVALLGYAGLGATPRGMEPSEWMSNVLRGRGELTVEDSLGVIVTAANIELPGYLARFPGEGTQQIVVPALVQDERRSYIIGIRKDRYLFQRTLTPVPAMQLPHPILTVGSGEAALFKEKDFVRSILRPVRHFDQGRIDGHVAAQQLAKINYRIHVATEDGTVGPDCIVVWRIRKVGGGAHVHFQGTKPDPQGSPALPSISHGRDMKAFFDVLMWNAPKNPWEARESESFGQIDIDAINKLPTDPDTKLR